MQVSRKRLATFLATVFVVNLVVMGCGAWLSSENEPEIPDTIRYDEGDREHGVPEGQVPSAEEAEEFADFALWTAWISHTDRAHSTASFTNDWPYSPAVGNEAGGPVMTWSVIAMVLLIAGAGAAIWLHQSVELHEPDAAGVSIPHPSEIDLTPSQLLGTRFILIGALLFAAQTFLGGLLAHYYVERDGFFGLRELIGFAVLQWLPWSIARIWHVDLGILWIATMWLGAGLFLAPLLTGREPPKQALYVKGLIGALLVVAVGGLAGIWLGTNNVFDGQLWWLLGNEGLEYLEIGRVWQFGLLAGFLGWTVLVARGFKPVLAREPRYGPALLIAGAVLFAWDVTAKLLFQRKATAAETSDHVIADRILGDRDSLESVSDDD